MDKFVVGTFVDSTTGMVADYFSSPFDVIMAVDKKAACDIYNKRHYCSYFHARVMAMVDDDGEIQWLDEFARKADIEKALDADNRAKAPASPIENLPVEDNHDQAEEVHFSRISGYQSGKNTWHSEKSSGDTIQGERRFRHNPMDNRDLDYAAVALRYMKNPEESIKKIANILADELDATASSGAYSAPIFLRQRAAEIRAQAARGEYTAESLLKAMSHLVIHIQQVPENRIED